jgi:RNA polymerase sigma-70 factor (ECF subfamily)
MSKTVVKISEEELITMLKTKSESGFSYLYDHYSGALFGVISRIVTDEDRASDVLQDTFVKIWKSIDTYEKGKGTLFTWMLNIARNSSIDSNRSKHVKYQIQMDERVVDNQNKVDTTAHTDLIGLKETVARLRPEYQKLIEYIYMKGYTQQEFSDEFDIALGTVKTRTRSALQELRNLLKEN